MNRKLTAKIQQLNSQATSDNSAFSGSIIIEPEDTNLIMKKGSIYGVYDISSTHEFDVELVKTIIKDVLGESYYQTDSISPVQSLEKSILDVKEKITHVILKQEDQKMEFNTILGVLWGSVLYVVQFGEGYGCLVRQGEIKKMDTNAEGSFAATSGMIKDEDVAIFATSQFNETYPPHKLLSMAISEQSLQPKESGLLLKFVVDTQFTEEEIVDFGIPKEAKVNVEKKGVSKAVSNIKPKELFSKISNTLKKIKVKKTTEDQTTSIRLKQRTAPIFTPKILIPIALAALFVSIFFTVRNGRNTPAEPSGEEMSESTNIENAENNNNQNTQPEQIEPEEPAEAVFYDIKITDPNADPEEIEVFNTYVLVSDKDTGKIYTSLRDTPKFEDKETNFLGIRSLENSGNGRLFFADNEGYKFYDLNDFSLAESYTANAGDASSTYIGFIYTIRDGSVIKFTKAGSELEEDVWSTSEDFNNAKSIAVAFNVYVLTSQGEIVSYTSGTKNEFEISGLEKELNNPTKIVTDLDFDNIYVIDRGNNRIVSITKDGEFVKEYVSSTQRQWDDLKSVGISSDEKTMYILNGSRVYQVSL